jgi:HlyD family secretion protein
MTSVRPFSVAVTMAALLSVACARGNDDGIEGTGTIEHFEVDVAPLVPARVVRLLVDEGDVVREGQTVAILTNVGAVPEVSGREAALRSAQEQLRDLEAGARTAEIRQAEAELRAAQADAALAEREAQRAASLYAAAAISAQEMESARSAAAVAVQRVRAAQSALHLLNEGTRPARIRAARAEVDAARAALEAARRSVGELTLQTPVRGTVSLRVADPGEVINAGAPVVTVARSDSLWVRIYLNQGDFARVRVGDRASARLDGSPRRAFAASVVALADRAEFTPRVALTEEERADLLFGVKVALTDATGTLKAGLPVTVRISSRR